MLTRKHFQEIADVLDSVAIDAADDGSEYRAGMRHAHQLIAESLALKLAGSNPRFDRARFLEACGVVA